MLNSTRPQMHRNYGLGCCMMLQRRAEQGKETMAKQTLPMEIKSIP